MSTRRAAGVAVCGRGCRIRCSGFFNAQVRVVYQDEHREQFMSSAIADRGEFWWSERKPDEPVLWESKIRLGEDFFQEIIAHPVPLDLNTLKTLKRSPLGPRPVRVAGLPDVSTSMLRSG